MEIPDVTPIRIEDKPIFDKYLKASPPEISEYTFTNLFMWRNHYKFVWREMDQTLLLMSLRDPAKIQAFPPLGSDLIHAIRLYQDISTQVQRPLELHRVPESMVNHIQTSLLKCQITEDRDNWDYIYLRESLRTLAGGDLFNIRKKLNKFNRDFQAEYRPLTEENIAAVKGMQECWCSEIRNCANDVGLSEEHDAILDALAHWKDLQFRGGTLWIGNKIIAYELGEPLNHDTYVIHIEKADPQYGASYQAINQQFVEYATEGFMFINREQDIGEPSLRHAKEIYHPVKMGKKWKVFFTPSRNP